MLFDGERKKVEIQEKMAERKFQLFNTLISAFAGALFTAIIGGIAAALWAGKSDPKPTIIVQPVATEKAPDKR